MSVDDEALQNRATNVIKPLIPADAEERVVRSFKQWNQVVREHIRSETGLKLSEGDSRNSIPVRVVNGFPAQLAALIGQRDDPILWRLIVGQPKLGGVIEGLDFLLKEWLAFERWPQLPAIARESGPSLQRTLEVIAALQQVAAAKQVRDQIKEINEDSLGVYRINGKQAQSVELYWMPISMVAAMLSVRIEDLTLVVLAHELTHGYTHIGRDIDGIRWEDQSFIKSDPSVKEGLAQFYAQVVADRIAPRMPGARIAFDKLLELQSGPYVAHKEWLKDETQQRGETLRFALIAARSRGVVEEDEWNRLLKETNTRLKERKEKKLFFDG